MAPSYSAENWLPKCVWSSTCTTEPTDTAAESVLTVLYQQIQLCSCCQAGTQLCSHAMLCAKKHIYVEAVVHLHGPSYGIKGFGLT